MEVYIEGKKISLGKLFAQGGEAEIYKIPHSTHIAKIFKTSKHPSFANNPGEQQGASMRIKEHQMKLKMFPKITTPNVITPQKLILDVQGKIIGYTMQFVQGTEPLLQYSDKTFREQGGISNQDAVILLLNLHAQIKELHKAGIVVGDLNDLNVLVKNNQTFLIDTDSYQFGKFLTHTYTQTFLDPLVASAQGHDMGLAKPYEMMSDWYAFAVMVMQTFLFVGPYGGVYKPAQANKRIANGLRATKRITVFTPEVKYPKAALPYTILSDELLIYLQKVFQKDLREEFPRGILERLIWTTCPMCGIQHAKKICPNCAHVVPGMVAPSVIVQGKVTSTLVFKTVGIILYATIQNNQLKWVAHEGESFFRENNQLIINGHLDNQLKFGIQGNASIVAKDDRVVMISPGQETKSISVSQYQNYPIFVANSTHMYWSEQGQLWKNGEWGPEYIGNVIADQTLIWVGEEFGFGISRQGDFQMGFLFDTHRKGINDSVKIPPMRGRLLDGYAVFTSSLCWYLCTIEHRGKIVHHVIAISRTGEILAHTDSIKTQDAWLSTLRGKTASANFLFAATDEGIVRISIENGEIQQTRIFGDTEKFVTQKSKLLVSDQGLYIINSKEIYHLKFN